MGTRERQEREREIVRRAIVDAAREMFLAEGFGKVSMRKIAERIEYSPAAIYSYFPGKDDIFYALAEEGFRLLCDGIEPEANDAATAAVEPDPLMFIRRTLRALYRFSQAHPEYYALMFLDRSVPHLKGAQDKMPRFTGMRARVIDATQRCIDAGTFPKGSDAFSVFRILTTAVHGAATMAVCGRLLKGQDGEALAHDLVELTIAGLRAGVPLTFVGKPCSDESPDAEASADDTEPTDGTEPIES